MAEIIFQKAIRVEKKSSLGRVWPNAYLALLTDLEAEISLTF